MNLAGHNLNTLVALEALLRERNVSRAARRQGTTQSAMSHALAQLRELLHDPLLVRVGNRMELTPFAEALAPRLERGLCELSSILEGRAVFEAANLECVFTLAAHDAVAALVLAPLVARLRKAAPRSSLTILPIDPRSLPDDLAAGRCDAAFVPPFLQLSGVRHWSAPQYPLVTVYRKAHPLLSSRVTLDAYCECHHAVLGLFGDGPSFVDHALATIGRKRQIALRVPYLMTLPEVLVTSDLVASVPQPCLRLFRAYERLTSSAIPFEMPPLGLLLVWHERYDSDPANQFFRAQVSAALQEVIVPGALHARTGTTE